MCKGKYIYGEERNLGLKPMGKLQKQALSLEYYHLNKQTKNKCLEYYQINRGKRYDDRHINFGELYHTLYIREGIKFIRNEILGLRAHKKKHSSLAYIISNSLFH